LTQEYQLLVLSDTYWSEVISRALKADNHTKTRIIATAKRQLIEAWFGQKTAAVVANAVMALKRAQPRWWSVTNRLLKMLIATIMATIPMIAATQ
jgi:hypothetical protein